MGLLDSISDFMRIKRRKAGSRKRKGKPCRCKGYPFPHSGGPKCVMDHLDGARSGRRRARRRMSAKNRAKYFTKQPRKARKSKKPYFGQAGKSSPFHACVSQKMYAGASLPSASKACSRQRSAAKKGRYAKPAKHHSKRRRKSRRGRADGA
jgi:hypothetical protein